jgi:ubiquitin carboxyl-terminal hydrolase L3
MPEAVIPLESNPDIFTEFAHKLGLSSNLAFHDVYSLTDKDLLSFIPRPCQAVIMLFPITEAYETVKNNEESERSSEDRNVVWYKQTVKNACGLYALLNAISNLNDNEYQPDSRIVQFKSARGEIAKVESLIQGLEEEYAEAATHGDTEAPDANDDITLHFITFIKKDGHLYELDGRRSGALDLGPAGDGDVVDQDKLAQRFQYYINLADDENKLSFSLMALSPSFD